MVMTTSAWTCQHGHEVTSDYRPEGLSEGTVEASAAKRLVGAGSRADRTECHAEKRNQERCPAAIVMGARPSGTTNRPYAT
jgi:hypothetical protein